MYWLSLLLFGFFAGLQSVHSTPLDDYVNKPDPTYSWKLIKTVPSDKSTVYILNLTSQTWMDRSFSSRPVWWHYMVITVPKVLQRPSFALLNLVEGRNSDGIPKPTPSQLAEVSGTVAVDLLQIPDQPIVFPSDPAHESRVENGLIAFTWQVFLESNGSNPEVLIHLPMTKAAVRGMDAVQEFLRQQQVQVPEKFVVSGISKRGWTTWLTAAVDTKRVVAIMPIVYDLINMPKSMMSMFQSLGGWTFALYDLYMEGITGFLTTPQFQALSNIVDPYVYFDRYRNTKIFQIQGADDEFLSPDNEDFFWNELQNATDGSFLKRIRNVGHAIYGYAVSLQSFYLEICDNDTLPLMTWTRTSNVTHGQLVATVSTANGRPKPIGVTVYQARTVNGTKRDFRLHVLDTKTESIIKNPIIWNSMTNFDTTTVGDSIVFTYTTAVPPEGHWDGVFLQATFPGPANSANNLDLTTETLILPNTYPFGPCSGAACVGTLV